MGKKHQTRKVDIGVRKVVSEASFNYTFEEGADVLLRLGSLLFLEKLAKEAQDLARLEGQKRVTAPVAVKATKAVLSDVRQFS
jgi:hypothetical protein